MKKTTQILLLLIITLFSQSCVKDLPELNSDPNNSTQADPDLLFKFAVKRGMGSYLTASHLEYNGLHQWMMYFANRGGVEPGNEYPIPTGGDGFWNETYIDAMNNAEVIIREADAHPEWVNKKAAATIWKTFMMHRVTDLWGAAPYSEAFKGNPALEFTPAYDSQEKIYLQMLNDLEQAATAFDWAMPFYDASSDLIFGGDMEAWIRFANSLRFRLAMRLVEVQPQTTQTELNALSQALMISDESQTAAFQFNSVFNKPVLEAAMIRYQEGEQYINPSKFLTDLLKTTNDPRIGYFLNKTSLSDAFPFIDEYRGVPNLVAYNSEIWQNYNLDAQLGDPLGSWGDVSRIGNWYLNNDRPLPLISFSEMCFLKAEAALKGMWPGDPMDYLKQGINAHMIYMNAYATEPLISESDIQNYINTINEVDLKQIITQKYLLFAYENVFESFAEFRRTGYPVLSDYEGNPINTQIFPKRLRYPYSEFTYNRNNYLNIIEQQGADSQLTPIWWAKE
ncbi:MAG: SusD/RagB family nutrient-binding outer membrane lipoprotein [Bacteroidetes bacterium]|nr:SusD/RagB family nutrient-binding outer membrane lipoprotein [Bacteroidota bacterium]MBU2557287.1 SusD/RagB family nutrient-binding outer membrane lipoprotein [Bacteroidota bacterium]